MVKVSFSKGESWSKFDSYYNEELNNNQDEEYYYDDSSIIESTIEYTTQE
jgi:hypothetical protein